MTSPSPVGRWCLGAAVAGSGLMQVTNQDYVRLVSKPGAWLPAPGTWAVVTGAVLFAAGLALLSGRKVRVAATIVAGLLAGLFVGQRIAEIVANPGAGYIWTNPAKILALAGGAWLLARPGAGSARLAAGLLGVFLLICGAQHFVYAGFVDTLVPTWIPPAPRFWTIFAGVALLAGGAGLCLPRTRRPAAIWAGVMIFLWVPLLHVPRAVDLRSAFELAGGFEALGLAGVAWLVAAAEPARGNPAATP